MTSSNYPLSVLGGTSGKMQLMASTLRHQLFTRSVINDEEDDGERQSTATGSAREHNDDIHDKERMLVGMS
jgi:hypothetical protein